MFSMSQLQNMPTTIQTRSSQKTTSIHSICEDPAFCRCIIHHTYPKAKEIQSTTTKNQTPNHRRPTFGPSKQSGSFKASSALHINGNTDFTPFALINNVGEQLSTDLLGKFDAEATPVHQAPKPTTPATKPSPVPAINPKEVERCDIPPPGRLLHTSTRFPFRSLFVNLADTASVHL